MRYLMASSSSGAAARTAASRAQRVSAASSSTVARYCSSGSTAAHASGHLRPGAALVSAAGGRLDDVSDPDQPPYRSGFACLVGRPNAGKTTLTNAMVGTKVGIVSNRPQTTRHAIRGVVHRPGGQLVLVDTPGLHQPKRSEERRVGKECRSRWSSY